MTGVLMESLKVDEYGDSTDELVLFVEGASLTFGQLVAALKPIRPRGYRIVESWEVASDYVDHF